MYCRHALPALLLVLTATACAPASPGAPTGTPLRPPTLAPTPPPAATPTASEPASSATPTAAAPLGEWDAVQQQIARYRSLLDRSSDGYAGLTAALEQSEPNEVWCASIDAAINDFVYVKDTASADGLAALKTSQRCP